MKRHTKSPVLDVSIPGDRLEHDRIQLEHNLQHTDLSLHLSSHDDDTIEYARHNAGPSAFPDFISFDQRSRDNYDADMNSQIHAWSYRTGDDEDGISPYGGETMSTAAHHASAITLRAGLGGRGGRRDISLSGAEYDPDRPLHDMMAAVDPKLSIFDMDPSRSRYEAAFDSLHGGLDRVLQSGHAPPSRSRSVRICSPHSSATSSASSDSDSPRPRLADALQRVSFSPKRPRSPHAPHHPNHRHAQVPPSPLTRAIDDSNFPTPRPQRRGTPAVSPPTPASQFTKAARGLTRDLAEEQQMYERNPFSDIANRVESSDATRRNAHNKSRVYLPDVTGLTNAVESPAKGGGGHNAYNPDDRPRDSEARLLSTLSVVQAKLHQLEDENSISRRRVRELELELEVCKREVVRERTRILERAEVTFQQEAASTRAKGKGKAREADQEASTAGEMEQRYREVVEEKKALESLISTLRTHLTRLTSELSSHQELLTELRKLRERDSRALKEKSVEVDRLRQEVERLAGEVEVLRGVVEEGLRERRAVRDISETQAAGDIAMSADLNESSSEDEEHHPEQEEQNQEPLDDRSSIEEDNESDAEPFDPQSIIGSSRQNVGSAPDRTMRTDHATLGSSLTPVTSGRFISDNELARIAADVEERRSDLSSGSRERSRAPTPPLRQQNRRPTVEEVSDDGTETPRAPSPPARAGPSHPRRPMHPARPPVPTPSRARQNQPDPETPFPQIRGAHLERLFFSAPEHNARTCTVCCRRRSPEQSSPASWLPSRMERDFRARMQEARAAESDEDEGFAEGEDDVESERVWKQRRAGKQREPLDVNYEAAARKAGLPPQTIVARVIRELEDDFTHYKSVYVELADQYKEMDAVSDVPKRNMLAKHLREVVDILEQKGDQIASLYDCLTFKDKALAGRVKSRGS
ncbi:hypothetical protein B0H15DRAFT_85369 [Mycena belliarum]|uniref:Cep57 centrosome microtubule-binding domain-containing protein n=1 Tax=Mycena belliarum TaxID=1033014 RepID=A0AAD6XGN2_9AGAR|nr:hypothetical protein B0H15DRAFT_85369 [Mycena belliae]